MKIKISSFIIDSDVVKGLKDYLGDNVLLETEEVKCCKVPGCTDGYYAKGYCQKHYRKWKNYGDALHESTVKDKGCLTEGCTGLHYAKGYCYNCYMKFRNPALNARKEKKEWKRIQAICSDSGHGLYHRYGGHGVTVCEEWESSFADFYKDMGSCPSAGAVIDCDSSVFNKDNCVWKSLEEFQEENMRRASARLRR